MLLIVVAVLSLVIPPVKRWMAALRKHVAWKSAKWLFVPLYAGLMGLSLGSQHTLFNVWLWIGFIAFAMVLVVITTALTRDLWEGWAQRIQKAQGWLGIIALVGFVGVLAVSTLLHQTGLLHSMLIPQFLLLGPMFGLGGFQLFAAGQQTSPINRAMGVLFPAIGLLVIVGLL